MSLFHCGRSEIQQTHPVSLKQPVCQARSCFVVVKTEDSQLRGCEF
jgi:hypothetical protein